MFLFLFLFPVAISPRFACKVGSGAQFPARLRVVLPIALFLSVGCNVFPDTPPLAQSLDPAEGGAIDSQPDASWVDAPADDGAQDGRSDDAAVDVAAVDVAAVDVAEAGEETTVVLQVTSTAGDVNEDASNFDATSATTWLGTGGNKNRSYTGFRFTAASIPKGAVIESAYLRVQAAADEAYSMRFEMGIENAANCDAFEATDLPSDRTLAAYAVGHDSQEPWQRGVWYALDEFGAAVQAVVSKPNWVSGNALCVLMKGEGASHSRKHIKAYDGSAADAAQLVVTFRMP